MSQSYWLKLQHAADYKGDSHVWIWVLITDLRKSWFGDIILYDVLIVLYRILNVFEPSLVIFEAMFGEKVKV